MERFGLRTGSKFRINWVSKSSYHFEADAIWLLPAVLQWCERTDLAHVRVNYPFWVKNTPSNTDFWQPIVLTTKCSPGLHTFLPTCQLSGRKRKISRLMMYFYSMKEVGPRKPSQSQGSRSKFSTAVPAQKYESLVSWWMSDKPLTFGFWLNGLP